MPSGVSAHVYVYARQLFQDLFSESIATIGQFLGQPNPDLCGQVSHMD